MWVVMPKELVYGELPLNEAKHAQDSGDEPGRGEPQNSGSLEAVDGHPANKYEITVKEGPKTESFYQWTATDINFPIRTTAVNGEWVGGIHERQAGGIPAAFLRYPAALSESPGPAPKPAVTLIPRLSRWRPGHSCSSPELACRRLRRCPWAVTASITSRAMPTPSWYLPEASSTFSPACLTATAAVSMLSVGRAECEIVLPDLREYGETGVLFIRVRRAVGAFRLLQPDNG